MKRQIKFRAWNTENKSMYNPIEYLCEIVREMPLNLYRNQNKFYSEDEAFDFGDNIRSQITSIFHGYIMCYDGNQWKKYNTENNIMQFTGVYDINGNEIYEGDIVIPAKFKDKPNTVEFIQNGFYRVKNINNKNYVNSLGNCQLKIIGNIYENPNLLLNN